jgi:Flp pilus assembly protein TadG
MRQERGQAMVEFAIVLPVLILILLGILYFGRYENYSSQETHLAEQAVRWAAIDVNPATSPTSLQTFVQSQASSELRLGDSDVSTPAKVYLYYPSGSSNAVGNPVRACITATVQLPFLGTSAQIVQSAEMRIEQAIPPPPAPPPWTTGDGSGGTVPSACPTS